MCFNLAIYQTLPASNIGFLPFPNSYVRDLSPSKRINRNIISNHLPSPCVPAGKSKSQRSTERCIFPPHPIIPSIPGLTQVSPSRSPIHSSCRECRVLCSKSTNYASAEICSARWKENRRKREKMAQC
ncbi:hypothetical protein VTL71DRAFT_13890 [Oculimacula yallundae]|uniref:Uncharacterized protein n=1 Tax=Oculimacula yallundae TaxID=86028 RepID=A0ABR4CP66_9HELO